MTHVHGCKSVFVELASRMQVLASKISLYKVQSKWIFRLKNCPNNSPLGVPGVPKPLTKALRCVLNVPTVGPCQ